MINRAPAAAACSTNSGDTTVPAPAIIRSLYFSAIAAIASAVVRNESGSFWLNVTSTKRKPPSYSASATLRHFFGAMPRTMAISRFSSIKRMVSSSMAFSFFQTARPYFSGGQHNGIFSLSCASAGHNSYLVSLLLRWPTGCIPHPPCRSVRLPFSHRRPRRSSVQKSPCPPAPVSVRHR